MSCIPCKEQDLSEEQLAQLARLLLIETEQDWSRQAKQRLTCPEYLCELIF